MEVFVWVSAGETKVYHGATLDDVKFIVAALNDHLSMWNFTILTNEELASFSNGELAKAALMNRLTPIIKDYSDDRFETGTGFTTLKGHFT